MKKTIRKFYPIFYGLAVFLFYITIYPSPADKASYSTALAVFFTAVGSSAVIIFPRRQDTFLFYSYLLVSLALPILLMTFFHFFSTVEQKAIIGIQVLAIILLILFVSYQSGNKEKKRIISSWRAARDGRRAEDAIYNIAPLWG